MDRAQLFSRVTWHQSDLLLKVLDNIPFVRALHPNRYSRLGPFSRCAKRLHTMNPIMLFFSPTFGWDFCFIHDFLLQSFLFGFLMYQVFVFLYICFHLFIFTFYFPFHYFLFRFFHLPFFHCFSLCFFHSILLFIPFLWIHE